MSNWYQNLYQRQALLFEKELWSKEVAKNYLINKGIKFYKIRTHKSYWHFRLYRTSLHKKKNDDYIWDDYKTKSISKGIVEILAVNKWDI